MIVITNAIVGFVAAEIGSSVGNATYALVQAIARYVWLRPEEGYFLDYPEDAGEPTTLRTVMKRLKKMQDCPRGDSAWLKGRPGQEAQVVVEGNPEENIDFGELI